MFSSHPVNFLTCFYVFFHSFLTTICPKNALPTHSSTAEVKNASIAQASNFVHQNYDFPCLNNIFISLIG